MQMYNITANDITADFKCIFENSCAHNIDIIIDIIIYKIRNDTNFTVFSLLNKLTKCIILRCILNNKCG